MVCYCQTLMVRESTVIFWRVHHFSNLTDEYLLKEKYIQVEFGKTNSDFFHSRSTVQISIVHLSFFTCENKQTLSTDYFYDDLTADSTPVQKVHTNTFLKLYSSQRDKFQNYIRIFV